VACRQDRTVTKSTGARRDRGGRGRDGERAKAPAPGQLPVPVDEALPGVPTARAPVRLAVPQVALDVGTRDERYREDMPRARRRGSVGSPVGWGRGLAFASVADGTEAAAGGWAGGPAIISICMSDHTHRVPPQYFCTDWILPHDRNYCHKHHPSLSLTCSTRPWQLYPSDSRWEPD
jgi:hypothetical protein